jgi:hypothetical protein
LSGAAFQEDEHSAVFLKDIHIIINIYIAEKEKEHYEKGKRHYQKSEDVS